MAKLMDGTYYLIVGGLEEDYIIHTDHTNMQPREVKEHAWETERSAYKNIYEKGVLISSICLHDNGDGYRFTIGSTDHYEPLPSEMRFRYSMLDRLRSDCEYFLGNGDGYEGHLWAGSVEEQIKEMRKRWNEFADDEKPEWLTLEQIDDFEQKMLNHPNRQPKKVTIVDEIEERY